MCENEKGREGDGDINRKSSNYKNKNEKEEGKENEKERIVRKKRKAKEVNAKVSFLKNRLKSCTPSFKSHFSSFPNRERFCSISVSKRPTVFFLLVLALTHISQFFQKRGETKLPIFLLLNFYFAANFVFILKGTKLHLSWIF